MCGWQDQLKLGFLGVFGLEFSIQNALSQLEDGPVFSKELEEFGQVGWFTWALAQGPSCILTITRLRTGSALWA